MPSRGWRPFLLYGDVRTRKRAGVRTLLPRSREPPPRHTKPRRLTYPVRRVRRRGFQGVSLFLQEACRAPGVKTGDFWGDKGAFFRRHSFWGRGVPYMPRGEKWCRCRRTSRRCLPLAALQAAGSKQVFSFRYSVFRKSAGLHCKLKTEICVIVLPAACCLLFRRWRLDGAASRGSCARRVPPPARW